jgi:uncharacterized protein YceH (UPF0502 family)
MGLENRRNGCYFYHKVRNGGRVTSEYVGGGLLALDAASLMKSEAERRKAEREAWDAEKKRLEAVEAEAVELFNKVEILARQVLEAAGYHRHNRAEWRKSRGKD